MAFFSSATYSYKGRYILNGTARYEGSNKLGKSRSARWLPTWNIASAWNMHEEKWFAETFTTIFTHATFKASYSLTADSGPAFVTNSQTVYKSSSPWRPTSSVAESQIYIGDMYEKNSISGLENSELTYEKKHELNLGTSLGFFNNRINIDADYYTRQNFDLIG